MFFYNGTVQTSDGWSRSLPWAGNLGQFYIQGTLGTATVTLWWASSDSATWTNVTAKTTAGLFDAYAGIGRFRISITGSGGGTSVKVAMVERVDS